MLIILRLVVVSCAIFMLIACSPDRVKENDAYRKDFKDIKISAYRLKSWAFRGRLALKGKADSWQANIVWKHSDVEEKIKLSGPLGQGATVIRLVNHEVFIDRGDGKVISSDSPEEFINQQIGMFVPVESLTYWVLGMPEPSVSFIDTKNGFKQSEWLVEYEPFHWVGSYEVPVKITVTNPEIKLKLVIDHWDLGDARKE